MPKVCNALCMPLKLDMDNNIYLNEYRSILLVGSLYKIIYKILSKWLKVVLPNIIDITQNILEMHVIVK